MKLSELFRLHLIKRLPAIIGAALITAFIALYYVGVLDVSFIQRPEAWSDNLNSFLEVFSPAKDDEKEPADSTEKEPDNKEPADTEVSPEANKPTKPQKPEKDPDATVSQAQILKFSDVATLKGEGYRVSDKPWADGFVFGKLQMDYQWPRDYSYSFKTEYTEKVTEYDDGTEKTKETVTNTVERPAIELYMGYILYDDNGTLYILGPDGAVLSRYNDKEFIPANTRDLAGRPLFYKRTKQNITYPTVLGKEDDKGNKKWDKTSYFTVDTKEYYYLAPNGQTFMKSDYNDVTDNRGLYFDYPAYYGNSSTLLTRYFFNTTKVVTNVKGDTFLKNCMNWVFSQEKLKLESYKFDKDGVLITDKEPGDGEEVETINSLFPYTMAYNYSENYATVFMDIDWSYEHDVGPEGQKERKSFDVTTNEMRIIDSKGKVMFDSRKNFFSSLNWTAHEQFAAPLYSGIESLGSFYFDHGYMRMRIQSYDCYHFAEFGLKKVVTDEDVLVSPTGKRFDIPSGYTLVSYSDGILLLEKDGEYGYLNTFGNWIRDPELLDAKPFLEGVAVCKNMEGNYGVIDTEGKAIIPFNYDYISNISSGTIAAFSKTTGWTVFQKMSK